MSEISVVVVGSTSISSVVGNGDTVNVTVGSSTGGGGSGTAATIEAGTVTTIDATQTATVTNVGSAFAAKFNFSLPRGLTGLQGQAGPAGPGNSLSIGTVSTGTAASATITGTSPSQTLSLVLPQGNAGPQGAVGAAGPANSLTVGSVTTGATAAVSITGSAPSQQISFVIPAGPSGPAGPANSLEVGSVTTGATAAVSITGSAPSQQISFVIPQGPSGPTGPAGGLATVSVGTVTTGSPGTPAAVQAVANGSTVTLNFTIPRGSDGTSNLADETPQPLGVASAGSALKAARADHIHAVPTIDYSSLTGVPSTFVPVSHQHLITDVTGLETALNAKQAAGNYATLVGGTVPSSQLPGFVDDVVEAASFGTLPSPGESGKLYVAVDTRKVYRWSGGSVGYVEIAASPGSTDAVPEGATNLYFTNVRAAAAAPVASVAGRTGTVTLTKSDVGLGNVPNVDATARSNHTGTQTASTISDFAAAAAAAAPVQSVAGRTGTISLSTADISGLQTVLDGKQAAGNYVTSVNDLFGGVKLAAGANVSILASGQTITIASTGIGTNDVIDGGWYYGTSGLSRSITITSPPTNQTASSGSASLAVTAVAEPAGTLSYQWQKSDASSFALTQRTLPASANWAGVTYGGGTFVAVAAQGAATSTDGITWTQRTLPAGPNWWAVTYGGGTFVTVGYYSGTNAATSPDGITWTQRTLPASANWYAVTYGNGTFVAVAYNSSIAATSADGTTWTQRTLPASANWSSVTYGNGTFVAVTDGTGIAATSSDGVTWTQRTLPRSDNWRSVTYGGGTFVAVAGALRVAATSADGITWTQRTLPANAYWWAVTYGNGAFLAVGISTETAATSPDGITWTQRTLPASANWYGGTYGNGTFVAVAFNSSIAATITPSGPTAFANVSGATSSTLALNSLTNAADNGDQFRVVVSAQDASSVTSQPATLTVS
jgi:hypothetical protein